MHQLRLIASATAFAAMSAGLLSAQTTTPGSRSSTAATPDKVTLTGCIERADQLTPAGGSTLGNTVDSLDFVLIKAEEGSASSGREPSASSAPTGTSGAAASAAAGTSGSLGPMYRLQGDEEKLNPHVGHRVEVVGTRSSAATSTAAGANAPTFAVESVKLVSESCPR